MNKNDHWSPHKQQVILSSKANILGKKAISQCHQSHRKTWPEEVIFVASPQYYHSQKPLANTSSIPHYQFPPLSTCLFFFFNAVASYFLVSKSSHDHWQWKKSHKLSTQLVETSHPRADTAGRAHSVIELCSILNHPRFGEPLMQVLLP